MSAADWVTFVTTDGGEVTINRSMVSHFQTHQVPNEPDEFYVAVYLPTQVVALAGDVDKNWQVLVDWIHEE